MAVGSKIQRNIGNTEIVKGNAASGLEFAALDVVDSCSGESCTIYEVCKHCNVGSPCGIQIEFLGVAAQKTLACVRNGEESEIIRVGLLMMPLYLHLIKLKIFEYGSSVIGHKTQRINPVMKETRETVKALDTMLSKLGGDGRNGGSGKKKSASEIGDPEFYDTLFTSDPEKKPQYSEVRSKRRRVKGRSNEGNRDSSTGSEDSVQ